MGRKTAHIISHTHWDREWYMPYEYHHYLLVELMDTLIDTMDRDPEFKSFHLDGQTIMLEDYLQIRPEMKDKLEQYVREGRIHIGPWYILQDEFLTSSEANIRNLQIGHQDAKRYGAISKVGYFPDSFGNMGQAPQILQQAGIDAAVFGRGVKPTGFNNTVSEAGAYESPFSEMIWKSPDGSTVIGVLFANWYCNGMEVPTEEPQALAYWEKRLNDAEKFAATDHLLFMNGCDHQPVQTDLSAAIRTAEKLFPDVDFVHSNFDLYMSALKESLPEQLQTVEGELRSQRTDGWYTLVNTASSRVYLKQMNQHNQTLLEKVAEPLATFAHGLGRPYPHALLTYAWKTLMQNHPHDSICGCSVDEVHREMETRFAKAQHMSEMIISESVQQIVKQIDTTGFEAFGTGVLPFTVFNTSGWRRSGVVTVELKGKRLYFSEGNPVALARQVKAEPWAPGKLVDGQGREIPCTMEDLGVQFGYDLPKDKFRQPYVARGMRLTFQAQDVPALGYATYAWVETSAASFKETMDSLVGGHQTLENAYLKVVVADNGSLTVTDKQSGHTFTGLGIYEDTGDIGNEYMFFAAANAVPLTTEHLLAQVTLVEDSPYRATLEVRHEGLIPASADGQLKVECEELVAYPDRTAGRSDKYVPMIITTQYSLEKDAKGLKVKVTMDNEAKDHRIRVLFPTCLNADSHAAESVFELARRDNETAPEWENPNNAQHQHTFVSISDGKVGLTIANKGLNEYELLRDGRNTIAVTLLRSTGELGDWGVFPTPEAQCLGQYSAEFEVIPHAGDVLSSQTFALAHQYQIPWIAEQTGIQAGQLPLSHSFLTWQGKDVVFSSLKMNEERQEAAARWFNFSLEPTTLEVESSDTVGTGGFYRSNVLEEALEPISGQGSNRIQLTLGQAEIITIGIR